MIRLIASVDQKMGIAKDGKEPAPLPGERRYFKELTMQHGGVLLMGRKTYEAIGRALPGRQNFVLSANMPATAGVSIERDLDIFLRQHPEVWVIGGESVFRQTLNFADELYITRIEGDFDCDQFFPPFDASSFTLKQRSLAQHENGLTYYYELYVRD